MLLGIYLTIPMLTKLITYVAPIDNNIIIVVGILLVASAVLNNGVHLTKSYIVFQLIVVSLFGIFSVNAIQSASYYTMNYFASYVLYGAIATFLASKRIDEYKIIKTITIVYIFYTVLVVIKYIPDALNTYYVEESMELSYTALIGYCASLLYLFKTKSKLFKLTILGMLLINSYYIFFLSDCRGSVLSLLIMIFLVLIVKVKNGKHYGLVATIIGLSILAVIFFGMDILNYVIEKFPEMRWLRRFVIYGSNDLSSGRDRLYSLALDVIDNNFFFGAGVGYFESLANGQYTHNMFLQFLCEFGVIAGGFVAIYLVVNLVKVIFKGRTSIMMLFLIPQFIPRLFISSVYWENMFFWVFLFFCFSKKTNESNDEIFVDQERVANGKIAQK